MRTGSIYANGGSVQAAWKPPTRFVLRDNEEGIRPLEEMYKTMEKIPRESTSR
jgi:hypothetical protein